MLKKLIMPLLLTVTIFLVQFFLGFVINLITGIELFTVTATENIQYSNIINMCLVFVSILISNGVFQSDKVQNQLLKLISDEADICIEIDKNMMLVPEYEFKKRGTQLDIRDVEIQHTTLKYHFDFLIYNKTLSEATIKEIKMVAGKANSKILIAKSIAEKCDTGYRNAGPFKHFMIHKGKSVENKITFELEDMNDLYLVNDYRLDMNNIKFIVEYSSNNHIKYLEKDITLDISQNDIEVIQNTTKEQLARRIIGNDRQKFTKECLTSSGDYYCIKGLNHEFKIKSLF